MNPRLVARGRQLHRPRLDSLSPKSESQPWARPGLLRAEQREDHHRQEGPPEGADGSGVPAGGCLLVAKEVFARVKRPDRRHALGEQRVGAKLRAAQLAVHNHPGRDRPAEPGRGTVRSPPAGPGGRPRKKKCKLPLFLEWVVPVARVRLPFASACSAKFGSCRSVG